MAVTPMKSVTIVGHDALRADILAKLQGLGAVHLTDVNAAGGADDPAGHEAVAAHGPAAAAGAAARVRLRDESGARIAETDRRLAEIGICLAYIGRYNPVQKGLVESFLGAREDIPMSGWTAAATFDHSALLAACQRGETRLAELHAREVDLGLQLRELQPLVDLALDLGALGDTEQVTSLVGQTSEARFAALGTALSQSGALYHLSELGRLRRQIYFLVLHFKGDQVALDILRSAKIEPASLPATGATAAETAASMRRELEEIARERAALEAEGRALVAHRLTLYSVYDRLLLDRQRYEAQALLGETERTFVLQGWCPSSIVPQLEQTLRPYESGTALAVRDPRQGEQPPIILDNRPAAAPFEIVTNIFGWPSYREVDPTPVLAPFFALFFALALTDAGYGLIMVAYCVWMMKRKSTPKGAHKFFRLMTIGGVATTVVGALTGGWFGNALDFLPPSLDFVVRAKNAIILFDPVKEPNTLMILSLALGVVHLMAGVGVKMYRNIRSGHTADALMDQGLWLLLLPSLALMAGGAALGPGVATAAKYSAMAAAAGLVLTQGRAAKNLIAKIFGGLYSLYGLIGYLSDTLSYTRLLALGLATASLGMAINQIALMVRPVPIVGIFLMLLIMAFGHGLSLLINVFGAFIHSGRLQFVEFFTKFFEGGGRRLSLLPSARSTRRSRRTNHLASLVMDIRLDIYLVRLRRICT